MSEAIGMIETKGYTGSIEATGAMAKAANVTIAKTIAIGGGLITVICKGDVASVKAAVDAGSKAAGKVGELVGSHVIARPHEDLSKVFLADAAPAAKKEAPSQPLHSTHYISRAQQAIGMIETKGLCALFEATDPALKAANVS